MASRAGIDSLPVPLADVVATAVGKEHRHDPVRPRTGGPAGNARLTAWVGMLLLAASVVECATLVSLHRLVAVHIFVGALLVPLALLKTATTTWRMVRYYTGNADYRVAGPPPLLLRLLGPLVVLTSLAVLGTGLALVALGTDGTFRPLLTAGGFTVDAFTLHKVAFVLWLGVTSVHALGRLVPAAQLMTNRGGVARAVPGRPARFTLVVASMAAAAVVGVVVLAASSDWSNGFQRGDDRESAHSQDH
jgi:hypothetical protein